MLTYWPNYSRDLFFANRLRFAKFAKIRSSRKCRRLLLYFYFFSSLAIARTLWRRLDCSKIAGGILQRMSLL
ncbi:MAG: hypothetical protein PV344_06850, partial [Anaplasma sp.]|nr:hypothetical protein [Anaplasma sp.]